MPTEKSPLQIEIEALEKELASLSTPEPTAEELRARALREDVEFARLKKKHPKDNIGRHLAEPGQLVFRQSYKIEIDRHGAAEGDDASLMQFNMNLKAALLAPSWEAFQEWEHLWPALKNEYAAAHAEHMRGHRRERAGK